jgi:hypothetical protein
MAWVRRRFLYTQVALLAVAATALWVGSAGAARQGPAESTASPSRVYTVHQVIHAFKTVGIDLYDATCGPVVQGCFLGTPVVTLQATKPHEAWTAAVYVYKTKTLAGESLRASIKRWHANGIAATALKNLLITVVPIKHVSTGTSRSWPLPQVVAKALAVVSGSH